MVRAVGSLVVSCAVILLLGSTVPAQSQAPILQAAEVSPPEDLSADPTPVSAPAVEPKRAVTPPTPTPKEVLGRGTLIVVSIPSQRMFVLKDGQPWASTPVSTGKKGHETPTGVFPILQKSVHHRSTLYDDAPMPFMQRLTWGGVALHAGHLPGYRASHGCIRLPLAFARKLFNLTDPKITAVLVTAEAIGSAEEARDLIDPARQLEARLAQAEEAAGANVTLAEVPTQAEVSQTIQLGAAPSARNAAMLWDQLLSRRPELARLQHQVIPATVHSTNVFRLRASGDGAHAMCSQLSAAGIACFKVAASAALS